MISYSWHAVYRVGLIQIYVCGDSDTSDMTALTVLWSSLDFFVVPNWFLHNYAANNDISSVLSLCCITSNNLYSTPACVRYMRHLYQFI